MIFAKKAAPLPTASAEAQPPREFRFGVGIEVDKNGDLALVIRIRNDFGEFGEWFGPGAARHFANRVMMMVDSLETECKKETPRSCREAEAVASTKGSK